MALFVALDFVCFEGESRPFQPPVTRAVSPLMNQDLEVLRSQGSKPKGGSMKQLSSIFILALCVACQAQLSPTPMVVTLEVAPFVESTSTPDCQPVPGVSVEVEDQVLEMSGLQPGEKPTVFYSAENRKGAQRVELYDFAEGANSEAFFPTSSVC